MPTITCRECGRVFDLTSENDADEWYNGHDCEARDPSVCEFADDECFGTIAHSRCQRHQGEHDHSGFGQVTQRMIDEAGRYKL